MPTLGPYLIVPTHTFSHYILSVCGKQAINSPGATVTVIMIHGLDCGSLLHDHSVCQSPVKLY